MARLQGCLVDWEKGSSDDVGPSFGAGSGRDRDEPRRAPVKKVERLRDVLAEGRVGRVGEPRVERDPHGGDRRHRYEAWAHVARIVDSESRGDGDGEGGLPAGVGLDGASAK